LLGYCHNDFRHTSNAGGISRPYAILAIRCEAAKSDGRSSFISRGDFTGKCRPAFETRP
jgi:hypothetical protein